MCNAPNCNHNDNLDDDLGDIFGGGPLSAEDRAAGEALAGAQAYKGLIEERCTACSGTGRFRGYSGRVLGDCFKCKGKGKRYFRSTLAEREKATAQRHARKHREAVAVSEQAAAWLEANPNEAAWLRDASAREFEFATSLLQALFKYGHLTEKQEAAVRTATAKSLAKKAEWAAEQAARDANKADVNIGKIAEAFASAKAAGLKWPKLNLSSFTFSLASNNSRNAGAIYVKRGETYLGKIFDAKFTRGRDCNAADEAEIVTVCADPAAAAVAYGKQTGRCSCCGRELTNTLSVELGIGPICRERFGWA